MEMGSLVSWAGAESGKLGHLIWFIYYSPTGHFLVSIATEANQSLLAGPAAGVAIALTDSQVNVSLLSNVPL